MTKKRANPTLPIHQTRMDFDKKGRMCRISIDITQTDNKEKYPPDGIKAVFKVICEASEDEFEETVLIDNHEPFGYHNHDKLPGEHNSRETIHVDNWQDAWQIFASKIKELF